MRRPEFWDRRGGTNSHVFFCFQYFKQLWLTGEFVKPERLFVRMNTGREELQTRRQFFKKAASRVLPLLGAVTFGPAMVTSMMSCDDCSDCTGACLDTCAGTCAEKCIETCRGSAYVPPVSDCNGNCQGTCGANCQSTCSTTCIDGCNDGCAETCNATCQTACSTSCQNDCNTTCKGTSKGDCVFGCENSCGGTCGTQCDYSCIDKCSKTCKGGCKVVCADSCESACKETCLGSCKDTCIETCKGSCSITCTTACKNDCDNTCLGGCTNTCTGGCSNSCQGSCSNACATGCSNNCNSTCQGTAIGVQEHYELEVFQSGMKTVKSGINVGEIACKNTAEIRFYAYAVSSGTRRKIGFLPGNYITLREMHGYDICNFIECGGVNLRDGVYYPDGEAIIYPLKNQSWDWCRLTATLVYQSKETTAKVSFVIFPPHFWDLFT